MKILLLDNYDSFTYNLLHLVDQFDGIETDVIRNDEISIGRVEQYDRILISPGPGIPSEAGITQDLIRMYHASKPILGVCLGMQAMAEVFGGKLINLLRVFHGVSLETKITARDEKLFEGIPSSFKSGRYHSWAVDRKYLPAAFNITAEDEFGYVMAITHENQLLRGVQFHPESILTDCGKLLMANWLFRC
jgi:anthranilate synthase component II